MRDVEVLADLLREALPEARVVVGAESVSVSVEGRRLVWWREGHAWASIEALTLADTEGAVRATVRWLREAEPQ